MNNLNPRKRSGVIFMIIAAALLIFGLFIVDDIARQKMTEVANSYYFWNHDELETIASQYRTIRAISIILGLAALAVGALRYFGDENTERNIKNSVKQVINPSNTAYNGYNSSGATQNRNSTVQRGAGAGGVTCLAGQYAGRSFPLGSGQTVLIGRDSAACNIVLSQGSDMVSRRHCAVRFDGGAYTVTDYSSNGTFTHDGRRLQPQTQVRLPAGTQIYLGSRSDMFRLG